MIGYRKASSHCNNQTDARPKNRQRGDTEVDGHRSYGKVRLLPKKESGFLMRLLCLHQKWGNCIAPQRKMQGSENGKRRR